MTPRDTSKAQRRLYEPDPDSALEAFHNDDSQVRGVMGPTGSGKSTGMIGELTARALKQEPDMLGIRRTRWAVVRESYPSLVSTTLKTWATWMPQAHINMSPPMRWRWQQENVLEDGTGVDMDVVFLSVKDPKADITKLRSLDVTGIWLNEAQEIQDRVLVEWMINRIGRYPDPQTAPLTWRGLIMDANAMPLKHWWYKWAEKNTPEGYKFWRQPPALIQVEKGTPGAKEDACGIWWAINPKCENLKGQAMHKRYWLDQVPGKHTSWIKLNLCAEYGQPLAGKPVYPEFDETRHVGKEPLILVPGLGIVLGFDFGLTPCCCICQLTPGGQLRVIDECCSVSMGMRQFLRDRLKPMLATKYPGVPVSAVGEPSGNIRAQSDESTAMDEIRSQGIDIKAAPTNLFKPRRDAVASFMLKHVNSMATGERSAEGFLVSPICETMLEGLRGEYKYSSVVTQEGQRWKDTVEENGMDHIQDGLQALAVTYDRPIQDRNILGRIWGSNDGKKFEITTPADYFQV